jgi:hypothetical protein
VAFAIAPLMSPLPLMARPTKDDTIKRDLTVRVRVTFAEKQQLWQQAQEAGYTPSDYIRVKALGASGPLGGASVRRSVPTPDRAALLSLLAELGKVGSNVNQIARHLNGADAYGLRADQLNATIGNVEALTAQLLNLLRDGH